MSSLWTRIANDPLLFAGVSDMRNQLRRGAISSTDLLEMHIAQVERLDPILNAVVLRSFDTARQAAHNADKELAAGINVGPLHGIPMTVKESYDIENLPTTWGMGRFKRNIAQRNSSVVQRLLGAGAIVFGKTNVAEALADWQTSNELYGTTNNPWDIRRTCGGSSGGSATAIACGMSAIEVGSDIGGSLRNPAHYCGVFAHKPTYGIVPQSGETFPGTEAPADLSCNGPIARNVDDLCLALDVLGGPDGRSASAWKLTLPKPRPRRFSDFKVAVLQGGREFPVDESVAGAMDELASFLSSRVAELDTNPKLPSTLNDMFGLGVSLLRAATSSRVLPDQFDLQSTLADAIDQEDLSYGARMARGTTMTHRAWLEANEARQVMRRKWDGYFGSVDVILCPAAASTAPFHTALPRSQRTLSVNGSDIPEPDQLIWAVMSGVCYMPSTVVPIGLSADGLPIGVQIVSAEFNDLTCLAFAKLLEQSYRRFIPPPICSH